VPNPPAPTIAASAKQFLERLRRQNGPAVTVTAAACAAVFLMWQIPAFQPVMRTWFVCSRANPPLSVILSSLSHAGLSHLLFNLAALFSLGEPVRQVLLARTGWPVWPLLVGSAAFGSVFHLALGSTQSAAGCMGLSDVTMALLAVYARMYPRNSIGFFLAGVIPVRMEASRLLGAATAWSCVGSLLSRTRAPTTNVGHAAHLGGIVFGLAYFEAWSRRRQWQPWIPGAVKLRVG
jgi:membrane associated rhomboid family serine protease